MTQSFLLCSQDAVEYAAGWTTSSAFHLPVAGPFYALGQAFDRLERESSKRATCYPPSLCLMFASVFQYAFVFQAFVLGSNITSFVYLRFLGIVFCDPLESHLLRKKGGS